MSASRRTADRPCDSATDRAANAAFDAIDDSLRVEGIDPRWSYAVVMVMVPNGDPLNATVAANMPGPKTAEAMLNHALTQLQVIAAECGVTIVVTENAAN
jgi:hypothetical protein